MLGCILNSGDNVDNQEDNGFTGSLSNIARTLIDDYTKKEFLNTQLEILRPQKNIENNDKQSDEKYQINMIDDKESNEKYHIGENKEEIFNTDIEVLKLGKLSSWKQIDHLEKESDEIKHMDMSGDK